MKEKRQMGFSLGSVTLVMVFAVLCLTIFSVISLISARSDARLAQKTADAVTDYYRADSTATQVMDAIAGRLAGGNDAFPSEISVERQETGDGTQFRYVVPVTEQMEVQVLLLWDGSRLQVLQWQEADAGSWQIDESITVWDGQS